MISESYARYHARCWGENKTVAEIKEHLEEKELDFKTFHYLPGSIGNKAADWVRIATLRELLEEKGAKV